MWPIRISVCRSISAFRPAHRWATWLCCTAKSRIGIGRAARPVERLFEVMQVRLQAKALRLTSIELKTQSVVITLDAKSPVAGQAMQQLMDRHQKRIRFLSPLSFELQMPHQDWDSIFPELTATLQSLGVCDTNRTT